MGFCVLDGLGQVMLLMIIYWNDTVAVYGWERISCLYSTKRSGALKCTFLQSIRKTASINDDILCERAIHLHIYIFEQNCEYCENGKWK
jgi:hypothetical protein